MWFKGAAHHCSVFFFNGLSRANVCCFFPSCIWISLFFSCAYILKLYYINYNVPQSIGWRLRLECPRSYWITRPAIEICTCNVPTTTYWEGSNLRGCSLRLSNVREAFWGVVYCKRQISGNEMFCWFQAWGVINVEDVAVNLHPSHKDSNTHQQDLRNALIPNSSTWISVQNCFRSSNNTCLCDGIVVIILSLPKPT